MMLHHPTSTTSRPARLVTAAASLTIFGLALAGCSAGGGDSADVEQTLTFGLSGEPQAIKAGADQGGTGYVVDSLIHQGLLTYDADAEIVSGLAAEFEQVDLATYRFALQEGAAFSDGTPVTSEQVQKTFAYYADPANGARTVKGMENISEFEIVSDSEFIIHLASNDPDFFEYVADPTAFIAPDAALAPDAVADIGAGPFMVDEAVDGVSTTLVANPEYWDADAVELETVEVIFYPDSNARTNALISGEVDLIDYVAWEDFDRIESTDGLVLDAQPGSVMDVEFNAAEGPFSDPLVRQAVGYAVDRDAVAAAAFSGHATPLYGVPLGEGSPFASDASDNMFEYDPEKAKDLLAEAGYPDGFSATLLTTSQYAFYQDAALTVQADLAKIGIDVTLDAVDWATRNQKSGEGDYDIRIGGGGGVVTSPAYLDAWIGGPAVARSFGYENDALFAAFDAGRTADSEDAAKTAYDEAFQIIAEDVPMVNLVQREQGFAYKDTVEGFANLPGFLTFYSADTLAHARMVG